MRTLILLFVFSPLASSALAGPNAGGMLVLHATTLEYTSDVYGYTGMSGVACGQDGPPPPQIQECPPYDPAGGADPCIPWATNPTSTMPAEVPSVWYVMAAFPEGSCPRLIGVTFRIHYDPLKVVIAANGVSDDQVAITVPLNSDEDNSAFPANRSGMGMSFITARTSQLQELWWFAGYAYSGVTGATFAVELAAGSGSFADDSNPRQYDEIAGFGILGLGGAIGSNPTSPGSGGACCLMSGACVIATQADCVNPGGLWVGDGVPCTPDPCALLPGACCIGTTCSVRTPPACSQEGGEWMGPYTTCSPWPCATIGACCNLQDGTCQVLTESACSQEAYPHAYSGGGTVCAPNPCPQPGACCVADACTIVTESICDGQWLGAGAPCTPNPCPPLMGACCHLSTCTLTQNASCQGQWLGAGSVCTPNPCGPTGACCFAGGTCMVLTWAQCAYQGGQLYMGNGTVCAPDPCPTSGMNGEVLATITTLRAAPNPFTGSTTLRLAGPPAATARLLIFDAAGRLVRAAWEGRLDGREVAITWDGRDQSGREAPAGIYLLRVESTGGDAMGRLVKTR